jgi:ABC-2 type transport system permease protein
MNFRRTRAMARKEFLHIVRDSRSLAMALAVPVMMLLLFGYALSLDVDRIPTYVYDQDRTPESRELLARFEGSRYFQILGYTDNYRDIELRVDRSECLLGVVVPHRYAQDLLAGRESHVQLLLDGSDSNTASIARGYAETVTATYGAELQLNAQNRRAGAKTPPPVDVRLRVWYNADLRSKNFIVPGLIAVIIMIIAALITSLTVAREWETGTMEQLLSTPLRPAELLLGKLSAFFVVGLADMLMAIVAGITIFGVPLRGSVWFVFLSSCIFLFGALCWGILISTLARSQLLAYQMGLLTSFLPAFLLSGFIYATENMPVVIQAVTYLVPARYFVTLIKGAFLKGTGFAVLWGEVVILLVYAALVFLLATRKLRVKVA